MLIVLTKPQREFVLALARSRGNPRTRQAIAAELGRDAGRVHQTISTLLLGRVISVEYDADNRRCSYRLTTDGRTLAANMAAAVRDAKKKR